jgi:hypothetical protein
MVIILMQNITIRFNIDFTSFNFLSKFVEIKKIIAVSITIHCTSDTKNLKKMDGIKNVKILIKTEVAICFIY